MTVAAMEETDARGPRRSPRDAHRGAARRGIRPPDRSGEDPALDGNGGGARAAARRALSRQCHRGSLRPRRLPRGGAGAPPGLQLRLGRQRGGAAGVEPHRDRPDGSSRTERCCASPTPACPMPSNAPAMRKAGSITSAGWPSLPPGATRARIPGTAAPAETERLPSSMSPQVRKEAGGAVPSCGGVGEAIGIPPHL